MVTYCISSDCVALLLEEGEPRSVRELVSDCLRRRGLPLWRSLEAELYTSCAGALLIARPEAPLRERLSTPPRRLRRRSTSF
jgi:hypothetical protein